MFLGLFLFQVKLPLIRQKTKTIDILLVTIISLYVAMRFLSAEMSVIVATLLGCLTGVLIKNE